MEIDNGESSSIFVARQPVFDCGMNVWGYELLFREGGAVNRAEVADDELATQSVIADGYSLAFSGLSGFYMCLVNFSQGLLLENTAQALPPENTVVEILETVEPLPEVLRACRGLQEQGYKIALDDFLGESGLESFLAIADVIKVDILDMDKPRIREVAQMLASYEARLLAEKVETREIFRECREAGFSLFQGFFFSRPEIIPGRKLAVGELSRLELLKELSQEEIYFSQLAEIIHRDVSLTYRLLRYINSASFSFSQHVESIQRALTLLGRKRLQEWLRVVVLTEMGKGDVGKEIVAMSARRGKFLQLLAPDLESDFTAESLFLLGFLSLLDVLLQQPMQDILGDLPLSEELQDALLNPDSPGQKFIQLSRDQERADWAEVGKRIRELGLDAEKTARLNSEARKWADSVLDSAKEEGKKGFA